MPCVGEVAPLLTRSGKRSAVGQRVGRPRCWRGRGAGAGVARGPAGGRRVSDRPHAPAYPLPAPQVIYMARNPKDLVVSYYQFHRSLRTMSYRGTFQEFCRRFMNDKRKCVSPGTSPQGARCSCSTVGTCWCSARSPRSGHRCARRACFPVDGRASWAPGRQDARPRPWLMRSRAGVPLKPLSPRCWALRGSPVQSLSLPAWTRT